MKKCTHKNKVFSPEAVTDFNNTTQKWICGDCGFEGEEVTPNINPGAKYYATKAKFNK